MSITGQEDISIGKKELVESKSRPAPLSTLIFKHEATAGQTFILLNSLTSPSEANANGFVQPTGAQLSSANLLGNKKNFRLYSSRGVELMQYEDYIITGNNRIDFIGTLLSSGGLIAGEVLTGILTGVPAGSTLVVDHRKDTRTYTLLSGATTLNLGKEYNVGKNLTLGSQIGEIKVFRNGILQYRNTGNAVASLTADGNYQEVDAGNGIGTTIKFNTPPSGTTDEIAVEFGIEYSGDIGIISNIESIYGTVLKLAADAAQGFYGDTDTSRYLASSPSAVERRGFGDLLLDIKSRLELAETIRKTYISVVSPDKIPLGSGHYMAMTNNSVTIPAGQEWELSGSLACSRSGGSATFGETIIIWSTTNGGDNATPLPVLPSLAGAAYFSINASTPTNPEQVIPAPTIRVLGPQVAYLVPYAVITTPANARVSTRIYAKRLT